MRDSNWHVCMMQRTRPLIICQVAYTPKLGGKRDETHDVLSGEDAPFRQQPTPLVISVASNRLPSGLCPEGILGEPLVRQRAAPEIRPSAEPMDHPTLEKH